MSSVCRICLVSNKQLHSVKNNMLHSIYEKLTNTKFNSDDSRPRAVCCFCYQKLLRCYTFSKMALRSEKMLSHIYDKGLEVTHDYISEVNLNMKQHLSLATMPFITIDGNATNVGSQLSIKDEPLPIDIDIKEEVTTEPEKLSEIKSFPKDCIKNQLTFNEDGDGENDTEELLSKTHIDQFKPDDSSCTIKGEPQATIEIKKEIITELDKLVEIGSFPEHSTKSRLKFEEDYSDQGQDVEELLHKIHNEKTRSDNSKIPVQVKQKQYSSRKKHIETTSMIEDKAIHKQKKKLACPVCDKTFDAKSHLFHHQRTHRCKKPFACYVCEKQYYRKHHLVQHLKTHTGEKPFACNVCEKQYYHKYHLVKHLRTHTDKTKVQVVRGTSDQAAEAQSAKMLLFLQNGEQRLITFTLPRESCTLQEVLELVHVPFSEDTHIQCLQNHADSLIDYFVSVGSTTRIEEMLEKHQMIVGETGRSYPSIMARRQSRKVSTPEKSSPDPVNGSKSPGQLSPPPRHVDGMLALCKSCGYTSFDFNRCERCKRVFTEEPKRVPIARKKLNERKEPERLVIDDPSM